MDNGLPWLGVGRVMRVRKPRPQHPVTKSAPITIAAKDALGRKATVSVIVSCTPMVITLAPPVVVNANFSLSLPATNGQLVGIMTASSSASAWAITAGNSLGYFAIDNNGHLTVTAVGASNLTTGTYNLTVQATNSAGSGTGTASVNVTSGAATNILLAGQSGPNISVSFSTAQDAGSLVGAITVTMAGPGTYVGVISTSGADAARFSLSPSSNVASASYPCSLYVSQTNLPAGTYVINLTATP